MLGLETVSGKLPTSPSDMQLGTDLRRTALLRALLQRTDISDAATPAPPPHPAPPSLLGAASRAYPSRHLAFGGDVKAEEHPGREGALRTLDPRLPPWGGPSGGYREAGYREAGHGRADMRDSMRISGGFPLPYHPQHEAHQDLRQACHLYTMERTHT